MTPEFPKIDRHGDYSPRDHLVRALCTSSLWLGLGALVLTLFFLAVEAGIWESGIPNLSGFLWTEGWSPLANPARLGIAHAWVSTFIVTGVSLGIAVPLGFGIGLFAAELAPSAMRRALQPLLEVLAGIPGVVYGFFGYVTLVKWFEVWFSQPTGECVLASGIILAVMVLPFIASTSAEAFRMTFQEYREAVLSLGVTRLYLLSRVVWVKALPGLLAAVALGLARGLGETLAVLMLCGNSCSLPTGLLERGQPITALLATELGETAVHSEKYQVLFTTGLFLMVMVLAINFGIVFLKQLFFARAYD